MEHLPKVIVGTIREPGSSECFRPLPDTWRLAQAAYEDLRRMGMPRVNILLMCTPSITGNIVGMLLQKRQEPAASWRPGEGLLLPLVKGSATMVLHDVGSLTPGDQLRLLAWLEQTTTRAQVISTNSGPLFPLVQAGVFNETLFYRLNTVCLNVTV